MEPWNEAKAAAGAGVIISLRSATVQEAAQTLTAVFFIPPILLTATLFVLVPLLKDNSGPISAFFATLDGTQILFIFIAVLIVLNAGVLSTAMARFQRSRLFLD